MTDFDKNEAVSYCLIETYRLGWRDGYFHKKHHYFAAVAVYNAAYTDGMLAAELEKKELERDGGKGAEGSH